MKNQIVLSSILIFIALSCRTTKIEHKQSKPGGFKEKSGQLRLSPNLQRDLKAFYSKLLSADRISQYESLEIERQKVFASLQKELSPVFSGSEKLSLDEVVFLRGVTGYDLSTIDDFIYDFDARLSIQNLQQMHFYRLKNAYKLDYSDFVQNDQLKNYYKSLFHEADTWEKYISEYLTHLDDDTFKRVLIRSVSNLNPDHIPILTLIENSNRPLMQKFFQGGVEVLLNQQAEGSMSDSSLSKSLSEIEKEQAKLKADNARRKKQLSRITDKLPHDELDDLKTQIESLPQFKGKKVEVFERNILGTGTIASTIRPIVDGKPAEVVVKVYKKDAYLYIAHEKDYVRSRKDLSANQRQQLLQNLNKIELEVSPKYELESGNKGKNAYKRFSKGGVRVPKAAYFNECPRCLVQDFVQGQNLTQNSFIDLNKNPSSAEIMESIHFEKNKLKAYQYAASVWIEELLFGSGITHGDPHKGNLMFEYRAGKEPEFKIHFIDWGRIIELKQKHKKGVLKVIDAVIQGDNKSVASSIKLLTDFEKADLSGIETIKKSLKNFDKAMEFHHVSRDLEHWKSSIIWHYYYLGWMTDSDAQKKEFARLHSEAIPSSQPQQYLDEKWKEMKGLEEALDKIDKIDKSSKSFDSKLAEVKEKVIKLENELLPIVSKPRTNASTEIKKAFDSSFYSDYRSFGIDVLIDAIIAENILLDSGVYDSLRGIAALEKGNQRSADEFRIFANNAFSKLDEKDQRKLLKDTMLANRRVSSENLLLDIEINEKGLDSSMRQSALVEVSKLTDKKLQLRIDQALEGLSSEKMSGYLLEATESRSLKYVNQFTNDQLTRVLKSGVYAEAPYVYELSRKSLRANRGYRLPSGKAVYLPAVGVAAGAVAAAGFILFQAIQSRAQKTQHKEQSPNPQSQEN